MAEPEESPSSLAELEALAGLEGAVAPSADDAAEVDPTDFDLSRLTASAGAGGGAGETSPEDDRLDLGAAVPASAVVSQAAVASTSALGAAVSARASTPAAADAVPVVATGSRGASGFALGLCAGIAVAGVLYVLLRSPAAIDGPAATSPAPSAPSVEAIAAPVEPVATPKPTTLTDRGAPVADPSTASAPRASAAIVAAPAVPVAPRNAANARPVAPAIVAAHAPSSTAGDPAPDVEDPTRPPTAHAAEPPATPSRPIDSLLDDALGSGKAAKQTKASPDNLMGQDLPATPTAADVTQVIQVLLPAIRGCAMGQSGVANTLLVVRNDGAVATASITGAPYAGTASGRCMEGVLRRAKFPRFRQSVFRVQFPLSIRASS